MGTKFYTPFFRSRRAWRRAFAALFCIAFCSVAIGEPPSANETARESILREAAVALTPTEDLLAAVRLAGEDEVTLVTLDEVITLALEKNPTLLVAAFDPEIAQEQLLAARAEFDPTLRGGAAHDTAETDAGRVRSLLQWAGYVEDQPAVDVERDVTTLEAGIAGKLPSGLRYEAGVTRSDEARDIDAIGADVDIETEVVRLTVTQPLLRGGGIRLNRAEIRKAETAREAASAAYYLEQQETVAQAIAAYWDLVGAYAALAVRRAAVQTAEQLLTDTRERNALGALSDVDTLTAQSGLARRQNDLIAAVSDVGRASDRLKALLDLRAETGLTTELLAPDAVEAAPDLATVPLAVQVDELVQTALQRRPEMHLAAADQRIAALTLLQARNARLPQLDAYGEVGARDLRQDYNGIVFGDRTEDTEFWGVGLRASVPVGNRRARAQARAARLRKQRADQSHNAIETAIMEDVRQALRAVRASAATVGNARKTVRLEEARLQAERERFQFGSTTAFQVLLVQDDVIAEQTRLAVSEARLMAQLANLRRAEGTLLQELGYPPPETFETGSS